MCRGARGLGSIALIALGQLLQCLHRHHHVTVAVIPYHQVSRHRQEQHTADEAGENGRASEADRHATTSRDKTTMFGKQASPSRVPSNS